MRGRTLDDSFIILDEAQNTTVEQMKMFLTRLGSNSKAVITGDITQIDLPHDTRSGLIDASRVLRDVEDIGIISLTQRDVVRHQLVQKIIEAYEKAAQARQTHAQRGPKTVSYTHLPAPAPPARSACVGSPSCPRMFSPLFPAPGALRAGAGPFCSSSQCMSAGQRPCQTGMFANPST